MVKLNIKQLASCTKGFLEEQEGLYLYQKLLEVAHLGPALEIGSYCGKSTLFLAQACLEKKSHLFAIDHHQGSEEQQVGEAYYDPQLAPTPGKSINTFHLFKTTLKKGQLDDIVIPIVANSNIVGTYWHIPISFLFIDGSHAYESVLLDYNLFHPHIISGGYLVFHDVFEDPNEGGQAPYTVYKKALNSGMYQHLFRYKSLCFLLKR